MASTHPQIQSVDKIKKTCLTSSLPLATVGRMEEATSYSRTPMDWTGVSKDLEKLIPQSAVLLSGLIKLSIDLFEIE